ncbi:hypothetical protein [Herbiconiux sp. L3-i23]|uniref:DUF7882 family protein n=1 Tax=Herbiconiux sp. L3-i23 TaxID=2905871 RepID=UPI002044F3F1|nr:hypothetical protein [Herbiconiux sp. L3-i23]BDI21707.1 hypothetical protein L3i23_04830 [Herbiconiux sp. L3-i23]
MGTLTYGAVQRQIVIDDRLLAHVEAVALSRLRRNNAFALRWTEKVEDGDGRRTIWVNSSSDLYFEYDDSVRYELDRELIDRLAVAADSNYGIDLELDASDAVWSGAADSRARRSPPTTAGASANSHR